MTPEATAKERVSALETECAHLREAYIALTADRDALAARVRDLEAALGQWLELFDGLTEPVPPVYWAIELEQTRRALAAPTGGEGGGEGEKR